MIDRPRLLRGDVWSNDVEIDDLRDQICWLGSVEEYSPRADLPVTRAKMLLIDASGESSAS